MGNTERQRTFRQRMIERGYRQLAIWVPARDTERVRKYIDRLTKAFEKERKSDDNE
jgi:hypothetical protein